MKKITSIFLVIIMFVCTLALSSCGDAKSKSIEGTWKFVGAKLDGSYYSAKELEAMGEKAGNVTYIVIKEGGNACVLSDDDMDTVEWSEKDGSISVGKMEGKIENEQLVLTKKKNVLYFEKESDSQDASDLLESINKDSKETTEAEDTKDIDTTADETTAEKVEETSAVVSGAGTANDIIDPSVQVLAEYTKKSSSYVYRYLVVKNVSNDDIEIESNSVAYDANGGVLAVESGSISALVSGATAILEESFSTKSEVSSFSTTITAEKLSDSIVPLKDFSMTTTQLEDKVIVQGVYNGELKEIDIEFNALFFKDGVLVETGWEYETFTKGISLSVQLESWEEFDEVQVYVTGYEFNW